MGAAFPGLLGLSNWGMPASSTVAPNASSPDTPRGLGPLSTGLVAIAKGWTNLTSGLTSAPPQEYGWAAAYDTTTQSVIIFGGCPYSLQAACLNETWSYSGSTGWVLLNNGSQPSPSARQGPAMDYDPGLGAIVLFGGDDHGSSMGDTWEWKPNAWTRLNNLTTAPPGRYDSSMAYDPGAGALVLFGGSACGYVACSDTWEFNGSWKQVHTNTSPIARAWFGMTYDAPDGYLLLFGGQGASGGFHGLNDTWQFNGSDWSKIYSRYAPPKEQQVVLGYDPVGREVLDFPLGTRATWTFAHGHWTNRSAQLAVAPPDRGLPAMASDPLDGYVLVFGGAAGTPTHVQAGICPPCRNDTWAWRGPNGPLFTLATASPSLIDTGMAVHFSVPAVYNGRWPWTYSWNFGDGTTAVGRNVTHSYFSSGSFDPVVFVNDSAGHSANASTAVTVNPLPRVTATSTPSKTDVNVSAYFAAAVAGGTTPIGYSWRFGDGNFSSLAQPVHAYTRPGWYTAWIHVTDRVGRNSTTSVLVKVNPALQLLNLTMKQPSAKIGKVVNFTATSSGGTPGYTYAWKFGDGSRSGGAPKVAHIYLSTGSFQVQITITDAVGKVVRATLWVTVT